MTKQDETELKEILSLKHLTQCLIHSRHSVTIVIIVQDTEDTGTSKILGTTCFEISMEISKQNEVN